MKIVISPAKLLTYTKERPYEDFSQPAFPMEAAEINGVLKGLSPDQLMRLMGISRQLADVNWERNQVFELPFTMLNARQAIYTFNGEVYEGLDAYSLTKEEMTNLQKHLRILSGQYGLLRPLDLMQAYRLEMGSELSVGSAKNLYDFWTDKITNALASELAPDEPLVNLASNEYFKVINTKKLGRRVVTPIFKDWKGNTLKTIVFYTKQARGQMVRYIIQNDIQSVDDLKGFNEGGYTFSKEHSVKANEIVFVR
ncbi:hypothetical protein SAMN05444369_1139 [Capnocytophaga haemolytica]|jgi:UPF0246 protein FP0718|uniref:UPF0246 protein AXF12_03735 n=1 Tax=Capnocytophaga haemolytica TaxID=45243 RepID=A0AAX2H0Q1_9FLAO|nr:peroxide stress protein YaaA [Capnocytophaga haemolytica]AMD84713.1 hypothetical protein AXF12_03735 [Capnocytophaga haemolytica]SFO20389.1 hypothetical protein SAMN05444369_1139 [Capnocytophaga haemolytica]SNV08169.1 Protein of uncharacterised function (DUF328) [Capnocytophaga haemolytica]